MFDVAKQLTLRSMSYFQKSSMDEIFQKHVHQSRKHRDRLLNVAVVLVVLNPLRRVNI